MTVSFLYAMYNLYNIIKYDSSNITLRLMYWVDFALTLGLTIYFLGYVLVIPGLISRIYLIGFGLPYLGAATFVFFYEPEDKLWIS